MEEQIQRIMKGLKCSEAEAREIYASDKAVDKLTAKEVESDLTQEQKEVVKDMRHCHTRTAPTIYSFEKKAPRANPTKEGVISAVSAFLKENGYDSVEIINKQGEISFNIGETNYSLKLTAHRNKKA